MQRAGYLVWSVALLSLALPGKARAQDPDSLPAVEAGDSTDDRSDGWQDDLDTTETRPHVVRHRGEGNPYLREVRRAPARRRSGAWAGGSFGIGGEAIAAPGSLTPWNQSRLAPTLSIGVGGTVGSALRLGLEGFVWFNPDGDVLETVSAGMITGRVYPFRTSGLWLKSGFGLGRYGQDEIDNCGCGTALVSDYGFAWTVGAGFESPVGHGLWLGPSVEMLRMNVTGPDGYRERVITVGLSLTFDGND